MGYTNYHYLHKNCPQNLYNKALKDCRKIIKACTEAYNLCGGMGEANTKPSLRNGLAFNGCEDQSHETFLLESKIPQEQPSYMDTNSPWMFSFCKTARKEYDPVVVACLAAMKDVLKERIKVSSDGCADDWDDGVELACDILGRKIANPIVEEEE